jgi:hypothetical protein
MGRQSRFIPTIWAVVLTASVVWSDEEPVRYPRLDFSGGIGFNTMRITRSSAESKLDVNLRVFDGAWLQSIGGQLNITSLITPRFKVNSGLGGSVYWPLQTSSVGITDQQTRKAGAGLSSANVEFKLGANVERPLFEMTVGYGSISTSPDAKDFGGYLFKTACYPGFLLPGASGDYTGIRLHNGYFESFKQDLLLTIEERFHPVFDGSLGYVASYNFKKVFEIGGGAMLYHQLWQFRPEETTPTDPSDEDRVAVPDPDNPKDTIFYSLAGTKVMARFSLDPKPLLPFRDKLGKNDLKLYGEAAILGLKNYPAKIDSSRENGELKLVKIGYDNIRERIPVMVGFNAPTHPVVAYGLMPALMSVFLIGIEWDSTWSDTTGSDVFYKGDRLPNGTVYDGVRDSITYYYTKKHVDKRGFGYRPGRLAGWLAGSAVAGVAAFFLQRTVDVALGPDILAIEVEYYGTPYRHDGSTSPAPEQLPPEMKDGHQDDWKWAVIANKKISERVDVAFKIASDHLRHRDPSWWWQGTGVERLMKPDEWYWSLSIGVGF